VKDKRSGFGQGAGIDSVAIFFLSEARKSFFFFLFLPPEFFFFSVMMKTTREHKLPAISVFDSTKHPPQEIFIYR
jgi:hypothetical protein